MKKSFEPGASHGADHMDGPSLTQREKQIESDHEETNMYLYIKGIFIQLVLILLIDQLIHIRLHEILHLRSEPGFRTGLVSR